MIAQASLLAWAWLLLLHGRFWESGPELAPARPDTAPAVDIVVPARDEAAVIGRSVASLLAQDYAGPFRVVLVDDHSRDGTAAAARALPGAERLVVVTSGPRPAGWVGKTWAMHQGAEAGAAPLVLFTDADIEHDPRHLATLVAKAEAVRLDLVSEMVRLNCASLAERALVPAFVYFFQLLYPFAWVNDSLRATAGAAGGTMLVRRAALVRIGGIEAIAGRLIDDCALAVAVKRGGPIWLGHSGLAQSVRPYPGFADIWRMVARSAYEQLCHSPLLLAGTLAGLGLLFVAPPAYALAGEGWARAMGAAAWAMMASSFLPTLRRYGRGWGWAVALPAIALFYMAATLASAVAHHRGRGAVWKGRAYGGAA